MEEIEASLSNLKVRHVRLDAELQNQSISVVKELSSLFLKPLVEAEVELMISRRAGLDAELKTLSQDREKTKKALLSIGAEISGQRVMQALLKEEMIEVLPLVESGALGSAERYRL